LEAVFILLEFYFLREDFLSAPIHSPPLWFVNCPEKVENKDSYKHKSKTVASTDEGAITSTSTSTRASTRTSDDRGRRRAEARPER
jgi:hypothetical protein